MSYLRQDLRCSACPRIYQIKTKKLISLLVQHLIDCDTKSHDCKGGYFECVFDFIQKNGITFEVVYPYNTLEDKCVVKKNSPLVFIDDYKNVPENDEDSLLKAVAKQLVSACIESRGFDFRCYHGGLFVEKCGTKMDHAVTVVGCRQTLDDIKYWIMRNSWESEWREGGYMRMLCGASNPDGLYGIAKRASYPVIH